uniref:Germacrene-D synthase n=1 Tax=Ocimum basilicum TaxID=39350 RepID=GDS_OCIBA|nr:RecName: Full=Germacrene-D synthase; AltName: Full=(-)-germacrene D synthase [Ocimum basilicum]AAV63786.1 germacrene D synthase [Ocimum basilicum]
MTNMFASAAPISTNNTTVEDMRRSVTYHPSVWKDHFLDYASGITEVEMEQLQKQKERIKTLLAQTLDDFVLKIELIDAIQRLGVGYHFEKEINHSLRQIYDTFQISSKDNDIRVVALRFRLLRQHGYPVPSDVFKKFIDNQGRLDESVMNNVEGMLSLYEASNYGMEGEDILDKALEISTSHLEPLASRSRRINEALEMPISKTLVRLGARKFISIYEEDESRDEDLLKFAKLDFNILQKIHQEELTHIARWWKELDLGNKLPFARDRVVECYFWILGVYFEPQYNIARRFMTKVIAMTSIIDDIYDVHGTLEELQRFTDAIRSWDIRAIDELPPYMRLCYEALLGMYAEMENEMVKQNQSYRIEYARQEMIKLVTTYMEEAKWCYSKYIPNMDEYMKLALVSGAYMMLATTSLVGILGDPITKQDFDWITNEPPILRAASVICRLMDDVVGHGIEQKISSVDCYMKENGCSKMEAVGEFSKRVKKAWKNLNEEWVEPRAASMVILVRVVNLARVINLLYVGEDSYGNSSVKTKELIKGVLVHPIK